MITCLCVKETKTYLAAIAASEPAHYPEMLQEGFELVLGGEAGVGEETIDVAPFAETSIIEEF